jgi:threonine efflux protein
MITLAGVWFFMVTIPGPNFLVVTRFSMSDSRKSGLLIALGMSTGAGVWATASLIGLSVLFNRAAWLYETIRFMGGLYLLWIGIKTIWSGFFIFNIFWSRPPASEQLCHFSTWSAYQLLQSKKSCLLWKPFFGHPPTSSTHLGLFHRSRDDRVYFIVLVRLGCLFFSFPQVQHLYRRTKPTLDFITGSLLSFLGLRLALSKS